MCLQALDYKIENYDQIERNSPPPRQTPLPTEEAS